MNIYDPFNILHTKKSPNNEAPGTIKYTGQYQDVPTTIEKFVYSKEMFSEEVVHEITYEEDQNIYWYNVIGLTDVNLIKKIGSKFDIHNMDLEDIVHVSQWSKIEDQSSYLFSIFKMIYLKNQDIQHEHVSIIQYKNLIITFQETPGDVFDHVRHRIRHEVGQIRGMNVNYLYYALLDALVDPYFQIINRISNDFKTLEMEIIENSSTNKEKVYQLRKELVYLTNAIIPIKDALLYLMKSSPFFKDNSLQPYYGDLVEHIHQIIDSLIAYKEMVQSLHEIQMSNISDDMNKTMMTLTIFSVVFIPLSFLAGLFGMNFSYIPGLDISGGFYWFIGLCILIAGGMLGYFKIKKWY